MGHAERFYLGASVLLVIVFLMILGIGLYKGGIVTVENKL